MADLEGKIQVWSQPAAGWTSQNPTLALGQFGFESDTGRIKCGDNVSTWNQLGYIGGGTVQETGLVSGGAITIGSFGANNIRVAAATWYIDGYGTFSTTGNSDFSSAIAAAGLFRYDGFFGKIDGTITKVTGAEASQAAFPATPADHALIGYVLVSDAAVASTPDLSGYLLKASKASAAAVAAGNSDQDYITPKGLKDSGVLPEDPVIYKGAIDCSANPDYPLADAGHLYLVSVAGKIGGASGVTVEAGDMIVCKVDSSLPGNHGSVGANWNIIQTNLVISTDGTLSANSDSLVPSQKAVKTYADTKQERQSELLTGGLVSIGDYDSGGSNNDIRVTASTYFIQGLGNFAAAQTDFNNIANCATGKLKSIGIFATSSNTILKVEGNEGDGAINPSTPANSFPISYIIWGDAGAVGSAPVTNPTVEVIYRSTINSNVVTGSTSETLVRFVLIPANTINVGDILAVKSLSVKTGTNNLFGVRFRINTAASISGSSLLASQNGANGTFLTLTTFRHLIVRSATNTEVLNPGSNINTDLGTTSAVAPTSVNIDWTVDQYFLVSLVNNSSLDSSVNSAFEITR